MSSSTETKPKVLIAGAEVSRSCHACAFFHTREEYYEVLMPFFQEGFKAGDKTLHVVEASLHSDHLNRLRKEAPNLNELIASEQFVLKGWEDSYLQGGKFTQDTMLKMVEDILIDTKAKNYPLARLVGQMEWSCNHSLEGVSDLVKYETRLNNFISNYDAVLVCCYELPKHSATVIMDVLRTHPYVLIGGTMHENPYFVSPEELLSELDNREPVLG